MPSLLWRLWRKYWRLAGVVLSGVARNACRAVVDAYCAVWRRVAHLMAALCRKCLYPVELSAFDAADAVSARGN